MLNHKVPVCLAHILKLLSKYVCTLKNRKSLRLNTQYATDSTLLCPVKMEYGPENNIFVQKMLMKSGLEKITLKVLHAQSLFWKFFLTSQKGGFLHQIANSIIKMTFFAHGGISIKLFVIYLHVINECLTLSGMGLESKKRCSSLEQPRGNFYQT